MFITMIMLLLLGFMAIYYFAIRIATYKTSELCFAMTDAKQCMYYDCAPKEDTVLYRRVCGFFGKSGWIDSSRRPVPTYREQVDFRDTHGIESDTHKR